MTFLQFADKSVPYGVFVKDVAAEVVHLLKKDDADPDYVSQRKAFEMFGSRCSALPCGTSLMLLCVPSSSTSCRGRA